MYAPFLQPCKGVLREGSRHTDYHLRVTYYLPRRLLPALCLCVSLPRRLCSGLLLLRSEELLVRERLRLLRRPGERERDLIEWKQWSATSL